MTYVDEEHDLANPTDTVSLTVKLPRALVERLNALVNRTTWDASAFVRDALEGYIPPEEREVALTEAAIAEIDAGGPTYSHEEVMAWIESWGKPDELPPPDER
jgi:predicted transcriptional regulator